MICPQTGSRCESSGCMMYLNGRCMLLSYNEPISEHPKQGETPRTVPGWIKSLVMQVNERVAEDATTRCTLDMENASNAVRDWQAQERELAQMAKRVSELEAAIAPAIAEAERANRLGADKLRSTEINAQYWLEGGRRTANRGEAVFAVEQAMNAYSNAAYGLAEDLAKAEAKLAERSGDAARWVGFCNLWAASTEMCVRQDEEGTFSILQVESVENEVFGRLVGETPDGVIDAALAAARKEGK